MYTRPSLRTLSVLAISLLAVAASAAVLGFNSWKSEGGCSHAQGRLYNAILGEEHGRMMGTITGDYWITSFDGRFDPDGTPVVFGWATSHVDGDRGTINFNEYSAIDFNEQVGTNGAVLLLITGGTGQWENASGHIVLSGYFHTDESTGVWDYQGEVCVP